MNILHHKSWHVRTKKNIERVRRDEEKAAEDEKEKQRKIALAEQEARTDFLRKKARLQKDSNDEISNAIINFEPGKHINFFEDIEKGSAEKKANEDREAEKKAEKEKWEKSIGLLTYLGQSATEAQTSQPWYHKKRKTIDSTPSSDVKKTKSDEFDIKRKQSLDPMNQMKKYIDLKLKVEANDNSNVSTNKIKKSKTETITKRSSGPKSVEQLRAERLKREQKEREKTKQLMLKLEGKSLSVDADSTNERDRRYNAQYNPDFVRKPRDRRFNNRDY